MNDKRVGRKRQEESVLPSSVKKKKKLTALFQLPCHEISRQSPLPINIRVKSNGFSFNLPLIHR